MLVVRDLEEVFPSKVFVNFLLLASVMPHSLCPEEKNGGNNSIFNFLRSQTYKPTPLGQKRSVWMWLASYSTLSIRDFSLENTKLSPNDRAVAMPND